MSLYLTIVSCQFGRYRYVRLPFSSAHAGDIFQEKIVELFSGMPHVFDIADGIVITGFDE